MRKRIIDRRELRLNLLISRREKAMLAALAKDSGLNASDFIRKLLRDRYTELLNRERILRFQFGDGAFRV